MIVCMNVVGNCRKNFQGKTSNSVFPTTFDIFCIPTSYDNLRHLTTSSKNKTSYDMLRHPTTCYDILRHATTSYDILRHTKCQNMSEKHVFDTLFFQVPAFFRLFS